MIAKQIKGKGFRGVVAYNQKKVRQGEAILLETNLAGRSVNLLSKEFNSIAKLRPNLSKCVYHVSLNLPSSENIADVVFAELAQEYLLGMGFDDNQYLIYRHFDCDHHHIHIVANRVRFDGKVVSDSQDFKRSERVVRQLEIEYGLEQLLSSAIGNAIAHKPDGPQLSSTQLKQKIKIAIKATYQENMGVSHFMDSLEHKGIYCKFNQSRTTGYISGISFYSDCVLVKGSQLGKGYGWKALGSKMGYDQVKDRDVIREYQDRVAPLISNLEEYKKAERDALVPKPKHLAFGPLAEFADVLFQSGPDSQVVEDDGLKNKKRKRRGKRKTKR